MKLRALNPDRWRQLVDLVHAEGLAADINTVRELLRLEPSQDAEALAARANATRIVRMLHDPASQLMDMIMTSLRAGKLCVVDVSQLSSGQALILSGLILRRIFDHNQEQFTEASPSTIPTIAVVEEAQAVLNERATAAEPYIAWVKEGRKYDLGAVLITQQPGSIPNEILSQGDNWFVFHLLSSQDLRNVRAANAHFGQDLLSTLLNEPIPGQGLFWSSVAAPYPLPLRVLSFEAAYKLQDPGYSRDSTETFATSLRSDSASALGLSVSQRGHSESRSSSERDPPDRLKQVHAKAEEQFRTSEHFERMKAGESVAWGTLNKLLLEVVPENWDNRRQQAYNLVAPTLDRVFGPQSVGNWRTVKRNGTTHILCGQPQ